MGLVSLFLSLTCAFAFEIPLLLQTVPSTQLLPLQNYENVSLGRSSTTALSTSALRPSPSPLSSPLRRLGLG